MSKSKNLTPEIHYTHKKVGLKVSLKYVIIPKVFLIRVGSYMFYVYMLSKVTTGNKNK